MNTAVARFASPSPRSNYTAAGAAKLTLGFNLFGLLYMAAAYTNVALWSGTKLIIPSLAPLIVSGVFFIYNPLKFTKRIIGAYLGMVAVIFIFYVLTSFQLRAYKATVFLTTINFCYSIFVSILGFVIFTSSDHKRNSRTFLYFGAFLLIGAVLDMLGPLRLLSNAFRHIAYPSWLIYGEGENVLRDVTTYGGYRPTVFASEPSIVGIWAAMSATGWLLLRPVKLISTRTLVYLAYSSIMLYLVRSPTVLFCVPVLLLTRLTQGGGRPMAANVAAIVRPFRFAFIVTCLLLLGGLVASLPATGALTFIGGTSFFERIVAPQFMAGRVISENPLLGIGLGNKDELWRMTQRLFLDTLPDAKQVLDLQDSAVSLLCNSFYLHWISCGIVGGIIMLLFYSNMLRNLGIKDTSAVGAVAVLFMFTLGGYTGTLVWSIVMILAAVRAQYEAQDRIEAPMPIRSVTRPIQRIATPYRRGELGGDPAGGSLQR